MKNCLILSENESDLETAGKIIRNGGLVAFPTETVYGLGANAFDSEAVENIFKAKGRPGDNPLIVHISDKEQISDIVSEINPKAKALIDAFFPAPLTVIMKKNKNIPDNVSAGLDTVGVRMPENKIARKFIKAAGVPIAAPSANKSGRPSPTSAEYVIKDIGECIDAVIDGGECSVGVESTVITTVGDIPEILRPGAVTKEDIEKVIGKVTVSRAAFENIKVDKAPSPGMKYKHYAPKAEVVIVKGGKEKYEKFVNMHKSAFALCFEDDNVDIPKVVYGTDGDSESQAKNLFSSLRHLDEHGAKKVYARFPNSNGVGAAVYNRLLRAAAFRIIDLNKPFLIGLTGQTGAGKGYVGKYLTKLGFNVLDSDIYARKVLNDTEVLNNLSNEFGKDVLKDGKLDRKLLAERSFSDKDKTEKLNKIMHPAILRSAEKDALFPAVLDAALLFEAGADKLSFITVSVIADEDLRIKRIMKRDGISKSEAMLRIGAQHSSDFYIENSDCVVINDGRDIEIQIKKILEEKL